MRRCGVRRRGSEAIRQLLPDAVAPANLFAGVVLSVKKWNNCDDRGGVMIAPVNRMSFCSEP
jgi:hypothetical protein